MAADLARGGRSQTAQPVESSVVGGHGGAARERAEVRPLLPQKARGAGRVVLAANGALGRRAGRGLGGRRGRLGCGECLGRAGCRQGRGSVLLSGRLRAAAGWAAGGGGGGGGRCPLPFPPPAPPPAEGQPRFVRAAASSPASCAHVQLDTAPLAARSAQTGKTGRWVL